MLLRPSDKILRFSKQHNKNIHYTIYEQKRSSATAEKARVTIRPVIAADQPTLMVTLEMTYVNLISLTELSICGILYQLCGVS